MAETAEVVGAGGRVYVLKGDGLYHRVCPKCGGDGLYHAFTYYTDAQGRPYCFYCGGAGVRGKGYTEQGAVKAAAQAEKAQERAAAKRAADQAAYVEAHRAEREAEEAAAAAKAAAKAAEKAAWTYVGEVGKVAQFEGVLVFQKGYDTRYGVNYLHVVVNEDTKQKVTFWGRPKWALDAEQGDRVRFTGVVKEHEVYEGQAATQFARCKGTVVHPEEELLG